MDTNDNQDQRDLKIHILSNDVTMEAHYTTDQDIPHTVEIQNYIKEHVKECSKRCVSRVKIVWSFISFLLSVADVTVIIYLSYMHFHHSQDMMAWLMLLPILLNFIGIFTFLSKYVYILVLS